MSENKESFDLSQVRVTVNGVELNEPCKCGYGLYYRRPDEELHIYKGIAFDWSRDYSIDEDKNIGELDE